MEQERDTKYENIGHEYYNFNEWMNNFDWKPEGW
jgi:hypothetical protein